MNPMVEEIYICILRYDIKITYERKIFIAVDSAKNKFVWRVNGPPGWNTYRGN